MIEGSELISNIQRVFERFGNPFPEELNYVRGQEATLGIVVLLLAVIGMLVLRYVRTRYPGRTDVSVPALPPHRRRAASVLSLAFLVMEPSCCSWEDFPFSLSRWLRHKPP